MRLIDTDEFKRIAAGCVFETPKGIRIKAEIAIDARPAVDAEPVRHGRWIECDYKTLEHGEIESAYKAGICCSECRTGFKKNHITYKAFCPACGAKMDGGGDHGEK